MGHFVTESEFRAAFDLLVEQGVRLPYDTPPGASPEGVQPLNQQAAYEAYQWNPPQYYPQWGYDPDASLKPSWAAVEAVDQYLRRESLQAQRLAELRAECTRRISGVYGASTVEEELFRRLRGEFVSWADDERDRLRRVYGERKAEILDMMLEELQAMDVSEESVWEG